MAPKRQRDAGADGRVTSQPSSSKRVKFSASSKPIKVMVGTGDQAQDFYIHEDALKRHSDFCTAALRGEWKEAQERVMRLPLESSNAFAIFTGFIYGSGEIDIPCNDSREEFEDMLAPVFACWKLADKIISPSFKNTVVDYLTEIIARTSRYPLKLHERVYGYSEAASGLKRLLVDIAVFGWKTENLRTRHYDFRRGAFFH